MELVSTSDVTGVIYLVRTIFVCYICIYAFALLPQKSERWIVKNYINVFYVFVNKTYSAHYIFLYYYNVRGDSQNDCY
jgi:hypothetical protein